MSKVARSGIVSNVSASQPVVGPVVAAHSISNAAKKARDDDRCKFSVAMDNCGMGDSAKRNALYFGDNLDVLRRHIDDGSVDLVYLDPPFNSKANYNVLYRDPAGGASVAQVQAFEDTWHWGPDAAAAFDEVVAGGSPAVGILRSLRSFLGDNDLMAYLTMMTVRFVELHRVLKGTGSLYLHCDPTASHYIKVILDGIFGPDNFRSELIWKRTSAHSSAKRWGPVHDVILFYTKSNRFTWNKQFQPYDRDYVDAFYTHVDDDSRRWRRSDLTGAGTRNGETGEVWRGINVTAKGRHWAYPPSKLEEMDKAGQIHWPAKKGGMPMFKRYLDAQAGQPASDLITDIPPMHNLAEERLGYPTQKPVALLKRIVMASSNAGDVVLDPFCGCGTAVHAAQELGRRWIGIDVTHIAIQIILDRLKKHFPAEKPDVFGRPEDLAGAHELARRDKYQFQWWAASLLGGQARGGNKKGADRGVDGELYFKRGNNQYGRAVISVKGGENLSPSMIRDLAGTRDREGAEMGIFICLATPTSQMRSTAASYGTFDSGYQRVAIVTVDELLQRQMRLALPPTFDTITVRDEARRRGPTSKPKQPAEIRRSPEFLWTFEGQGKARTKELPLDEPLLVAPQAKRRRA